jgi:hypothetical protein
MTQNLSAEPSECSGGLRGPVLDLAAKTHYVLKGSLTRDVRLPAFLINQFRPGPLSIPFLGNFEYVQKFAEIFESKG